MSEALTAADAYLEFLAAFRYSAAQPVEVVAIGRSEPAQEMFAAMAGHESEVFLHLARGLPRLPDPFAAGVLAVQLGGMVEQGANPHPLGDAMIARLPGDLVAARRFAELLATEYQAGDPEEASREIFMQAAAREPVGAAAWAAQKVSIPAAMAAWCRHPPTRRLAANVPGLVEDAIVLGKHGGYSYFVGELLRSADGVEILVLSPEQRKGFVVELLAVRNAAHLFALLEDALVGDPAEGWLEGPRVDPEIAAIARGEQMMEDERTFSIGWHYEHWFGLEPDAAAAWTGLHPSIAAMIGVESSVAQLPAVNGRAVLLMKPRLLGSRTCEAGGLFAPLHNALQSGVAVRRTLTPDEVDATIAELRAEATRIAGAASPA